MNKIKDGEIKVIDGIEYKLITLRKRSKWVSRNGDLLNPYRNQKVGIYRNEDGYPCCGGGIPVHLYVAYAWVDGYFEGAEVNHKDFDRNNYKAENLEWCTHLDNLKYSLKNNYECICKSKQGKHNGRAKYTEDEVIQMRSMYDNGMSVVEIIRHFYPNMKTVKDYKNIHSNITNIVKRRTWTCL